MSPSALLVKIVTCKFINYNEHVCSLTSPHLYPLDYQLDQGRAKGFTGPVSREIVSTMVYCILKFFPGLVDVYMDAGFKELFQENDAVIADVALKYVSHFCSEDQFSSCDHAQHMNAFSEEITDNKRKQPVNSCLMNSNSRNPTPTCCKPIQC